MSGPDLITVGTWREEVTSMGPVLGALDGLRRRDRRGAVRASFLTLMAVGGASVELDEVFDIVHRLGVVQPSRVIVVRVVGGEDHRLSARVGVHLLARGDQCLGIDDIALEVAGPVTSHLDSVVEPLTLPDLPVVVWCRERLPPPHSPLIGVADHMIVDSTRAGGRSRLPAVSRLSRRVPLTDFAWLRLAPLRRRLAAALRRPGAGDVLGEATAAIVAGPDPERALLAGWLGDRLPAATVTDDGETELPSVVLSGADFRLQVETTEAAVTATLERHGHQQWCSRATSAPATTEGLLAEALLHLRPDPVFLGALAAAAEQP
ncbi:MAG: glucose-6-phosphate dehydrogenase assembly protein OpcA [Acidimicrobiales bacterium]